MIGRIVDLFRNQGEDVESVNVELAAAALLFEVAWADHDIGSAETRAMTDALVQQFGLSTQQVETLLRETHDSHEDSVGVFPFTRILNESLSGEQKVAVVRAMWDVAYADNELDTFEEHTIRRIADLLYVSHKDFIAAKLSARGALPR